MATLRYGHEVWTLNKEIDNRPKTDYLSRSTKVLSHLNRMRNEKVRRITILNRDY